MNPRRSVHMLWTVGGLLVLAILFLQNPVHSWVDARPKLQQLMYLPDGEYLRMASLGYHAIAADVLWLQVVQVMGQRKVPEDAGHWLYHAVDRITTLDPQFVRAYEAGSLALCTLVVLPEESNRLLEKGMRHNPLEWTLPFLLGINYYFEVGDDAKAADSMAKAANLPGAPDGLARLAAKLYVAAKSPQQAVDLLAKIYEETTDVSIRTLLEIRLKESIIERDLSILEEALTQYESVHSHRPDRLDRLVASGLLSELPREPFGGQYLYESSTGRVRSSEVKERMRITVRRRGQYQ